MKLRKIKKALALVAAVSMVSGFTAYIPINPASADTSSAVTEDKAETSDSDNLQTEDKENSEIYNYAKALQLSMYFYDANKCGEVEGNNRLAYRANCHLEDKNIPLIPKDSTTGKGTNLSQSFIDKNINVLDPDKDGSVDLSGGYHDAGDHVKFGLPQSYAASTLGWGYYEFKDAYEKTGQEDHIQEILRWFNDYFLRSTFRDDEGNVVAFAYQVGDGSTDHCYWGSPELQETARPAFFATSETPASDQCAGAAASLAVNYLNFKDTDKDYADKCLDTAKALYKFAQQNRGLGFSGGFYDSSYDEDELSWAAVWLNIATGDYSYIDDVAAVDDSGNYTGYMGKIIHTTADNWQNMWTHSWDTVWAGVFAKLAPITQNPAHWYLFRWNSEYWSGTPHEGTTDGNYLSATPAGYRALTTWGSARYNTAAQLCALVYNKYQPKAEFAEWCKGQMNYLLGDNPLHRAYEVGYDENAVKNPHHRAAHGSATNDMNDPVEEKHTLWGALVGGPDANDNHKDIRTDYIYNEVAVDYNAAFVGALAGLYEIYGEDMQVEKDFPPKEEEKKPYYVTANMEQENNQRTQVTVKIHNDTSVPPHKVSGLKARYFFNISELLEKGQSINDVHADILYDQAKTEDGTGAKITGPFAYDEENGVYYIDIDWNDDSFYGTRALQFALVAGQDASYKDNWDSSNDYSRQNLTSEEADTELIPVYLEDEKVYGNEPAKGAKISINTPADGSSIDYTGEENEPINISADIDANDDKIKSVEYYADGVKIGETSESPYNISYVPDKENMDNPYDKDIVLTAKAVTESGTVINSEPVTIKVIFAVPLKPVAAITSPEDGSILDVASGEMSKEIIVESIDEDADIEKIEVFADSEKIGESSESICKAVYTVADKNAYKAMANVNITATVTLKDGSVRECDPITLKVKYPTDCSLNLGITRTTSAVSTNAIGVNYLVSNTGNAPLDLSKVKIRYYFTAEGTSGQNFYCDHASMNFKADPWYANATDNVKGTFVKMDKIAADADTYLEISFKDLKYLLGAGASIECQTRFGNKDWSNMNAGNDYSFSDDSHIVMIYDGTVVSGEEA